MAVKLYGLDSREYEHPLDRKTLTALTNLRGFDKIVNAFLNWEYVKWELVEMKGGNFHVTEKSCPELYNKIKESAHTLNMTDFPHIYTKWGYFVNAYTMGYKENVCLVLYSGAVDLLNDGELGFIIGHELGHIKSNHNLYYIMAAKIAQFIVNIPLAGDLAQPLVIALKHWSRMSELTADRAGLLACQDKDAVLDTLIKMTGIPRKYHNKVDKQFILEQAREFEELLSSSEQILKHISILNDDHPWTVMRAAELIKWIDEGEYDRLIEAHKGKECLTCRHSIPAKATRCPYCSGTSFK